MEEVSEKDQYRELTDELKETLLTGKQSELAPKILLLFINKCWEKLGYRNWNVYVSVEFEHISIYKYDVKNYRELIVTLAAAGMPRLCIAQLLHISDKVVRKYAPVTGPKSPKSLAGEHLVKIEKSLREFIAHVNGADDKYRELGQPYWAEHLTVIEGLTADAWESVTGATAAELDAMLESIRHES